MNNQKPVLVGVDGSASSFESLRWATQEASRRGLGLTVLHATTPRLVLAGPTTAYYVPDSEAEARYNENLLTSAVERVHAVAPDVAVTTMQVDHQSAAVALLDAARQASMVVLGSRGHGGFGELLLGSTCVQVATHSAVPVIVVPHDRAAEPGAQAGRVVVGVDDSAAAQDALSFAFEEASLRGVGLTAIRAWHSEFFDSTGAKGGPIPLRVESDVFVPNETRALAEALAGWRTKYPDVPVRQEVVHGPTAKVLIESARGADLLVVGSRGLGGFRSLLLGSVSHAVLHHAASPVTVIRPDRTL